MQNSTTTPLADTPVEQLLARDAEIGNELDEIECGEWTWSDQVDFYLLLTQRRAIRAELNRRHAEQEASQSCQ